MVVVGGDRALGRPAGTHLVCQRLLLPQFPHVLGRQPPPRRQPAALQRLLLCMGEGARVGAQACVSHAGKALPMAHGKHAARMASTLPARQARCTARRPDQGAACRGGAGGLRPQAHPAPASSSPRRGGSPAARSAPGQAAGHPCRAGAQPMAAQVAAPGHGGLLAGLSAWPCPRRASTGCSGKQGSCRLTASSS